MADRRTKARRRLAARSDLPPTDRRLRSETEERTPSGPVAPSRRRAMVIAGVLVVGVVGAGGAWLALAGSGDADPGASPTARTEIEEIRSGPHLVFQNVLRGEDYAEVSIARLATPGDRRLSTGLVCERVHFAGGQGLCLAGQHGAQSTYFAIPFGADFGTRDPIVLAGSPNLARVSADGRYGAASVITTQPSEVTEAVNAAVLIDMTAGTIIADLAEFSVTRDGAPFEAPDFEFWGVTFSPTDSDRFYATLRSAGNTYLVEGRISSRALQVVHSNVSAPSISPDGSRIAYVRQMSNIAPTFRFYVLDVATGSETQLTETHSIDDQMEWLDDTRLLYGLSTDVWVVPADGTGVPELYLEGALSPAVVR